MQAALVASQPFPAQSPMPAWLPTETTEKIEAADEWRQRLCRARTERDSHAGQGLTLLPDVALLVHGLHEHEVTEDGTFQHHALACRMDET